jgi:hypothetical protein
MHIDWSGLGEVGAISLVAGVGIVVLFSLGLTALDRRTAAARGNQPVLVATVLSGLCFFACAALVGYGLYLLLMK